MRDLRPEPSSCPFYNGITKCTVFNCMFNIFGVCTKPGSKFKERDDDEIEVIGNIHDNPELLEAKE